MVQTVSEPLTLAGHKLLILSPWAVHANYLTHLRMRFPGLEVVTRELPWMTTTSGISADDWKDVTILATGSALPDASRGEFAPKLQYVQLFSAGANHVAKHPVFQDEAVAFGGANGVHGPQIAEWVILTYLSATHYLPRYLKSQENAEWHRPEVALDEEVKDSVGRRIGILGYGAIGRQTARLARALGMSIHAYTLNPRTTVESRRDDAYCPEGLGDPDGLLPDRWFSGTSREDIHAFLGSGLDLLVIALPLTDLTRGLIGAAELDILAKHRTYLSNIARGPIVDTDALVTALNDERIAGAALDVTDPEPLPKDHPLWSAKNVIVTPHISGSSTRYLERVLEILQINIARIGNGQTPLLNQISKKAGY